MLPLVFLGLGLVCALISRILLVIAASRISLGWALGVLLPFGPMFFRIRYPIEAKSSMVFRYATLPLLGLYLVMGPGPTLSAYKNFKFKRVPTPPAHAVGYAMEKPKAAPTLDERRAANAREIERLQKEGEALRLRKRDLLRSDTEGNRVYIVDLAIHNAALAKANAEMDALWSVPK